MEQTMTIHTPPLTELVRDLPPDIEGELRTYLAYLLQSRAAEPVPHASRGAFSHEVVRQTAGALPDFPEIDGDRTGLIPRQTDAPARDPADDHA